MNVSRAKMTHQFIQPKICIRKSMQHVCMYVVCIPRFSLCNPQFLIHSLFTLSSQTKAHSMFILINSRTKKISVYSKHFHNDIHFIARFWIVNSATFQQKPFFASLLSRLPGLPLDSIKRNVKNPKFIAPENLFNRRLFIT